MSLNTSRTKNSINQGYVRGFSGLHHYLGGVSENTLRSWVAKGMPVIKVGDVVLFEVADVDAWLDQHTTRGIVDQDAREATLDSILKEVGA